jgi:hypothetical protein
MSKMEERWDGLAQAHGDRVAMARNILEQRARGIRRIAGTEWPIVDQLERQQLPGKRPRWIVVRGLCNGVPDSATEYRRLKEAQAAFGDDRK